MVSNYENINREKKRQQASFRRFLTFNSSGNWIDKYLGKDAEVGFLRHWIEEKFSDGMNWGNYGTLWAVDHIVPVRMFDVFNKEDLMICWNYRNLMPLFCCDNLKKQGNVFFAFELLYEYKDKDFIYNSLYRRIKPEVEFMFNYIERYSNSDFLVSREQTKKYTHESSN